MRFNYQGKPTTLQAGDTILVKPGPINMTTATITRGSEPVVVEGGNPNFLIPTSNPSGIEIVADLMGASVGLQSRKVADSGTSYTFKFEQQS
jgi:hypothetical protein